MKDKNQRGSNLSSPGKRTEPIAQESVAKLTELFANERSINVNKIAKTLGISRNELFEFLVEHGESILLI